MTRTAKRRIGIAATLFAGALLMQEGVAKAPAPGVFSEVQTAVVPRTSSALEPATMRSRVVQVDTRKITAARRGREILKLNLFDDAVVEVRIKRVRPTRTGYFISGTPRGKDWGEVRLVVNGPVMVGTVETSEGKFTIRSGGAGRHLIRQIDPVKETLECSVEDPPLPPRPEEAISSIDRPLSSAPPLPPAPLADDMPTEDGSQVRVLVVYTPELQAQQGGPAGMRALIDLMVQSANQAYEDGGINPRLVLAHAAMLRYNAHGSRTDLSRLVNRDDGYMDEVHTLRNTYSADLVHLLTNVGYQASGSAFVLRSETLRTENTSGFAVTATAKEDTFIHEIGHNFGLRHDRHVDSPTYAIYPYAFGYINQNALDPGSLRNARWRTIMTYPRGCTDARVNCVQLLRFSNSDQIYLGDPMGVPASSTATGEDGPADARLTINNTARWVGSFRSDACSETRVSEATQVVSAGGGEATFRVRASHGCVWEVASQSEFVQITSDVRNAGVGNVTVSVEENASGVERSAALTVAGQTVTLRQLGTTEGVCDRTTAVMEALTRAAGYYDPEQCNEVSAAALSRIGSISLNSKSLTSLSAGDFDGLSGLTRLNLSGNELTDLPEDLFDGLTSLAQLVLSYNKLSRIPSDLLAGLTRLKTLELNNNQLGELPAGLFAGLSSLETLALERNDLKSLPEGLFGGLAKLQKLSLAYNQLSELPTGSFEGLAGLKKLVLRGNNLTRLPGGIFAGLTNLETLELDTRLVEVPEDSFTGLSNLKTLSLDHIQPATLPVGLFKGLSSLERLHFWDGRLTELPVGLFAGLSKLKELNLYSNQLAALPEGLFSGLSSLEVLSLGANNLSSLPSGIFSGLSSIRTIDLAKNQLSSLPPGVFSGLSGLENLSLGGNRMDPLLLPVSLEKVGESQFKAVVSTGAPFAISLPVSVNSSGEITGGASAVTIPAGASESLPVTVTRVQGALEPVDADIDTPPGLPSGHSGYALARDETLPRRILASLLNTDATLTGLSLSNGALEPEFSADTISYSALVANTVSSVTISPIKSNANATVAFLNADDQALVDANANIDGHQVDLNVGENTVKIKVTAGDTTSNRTYTLLIARDGPEGVCLRTPVVRDGIVKRIPGIDECWEVTQAHLSAMIYLDFVRDPYVSLKSGDFSGLTALKKLYIPGTQLTGLPADIFSGLTALEELSLANNRLSSLPAEVFSGLTALEKLYLYSNRLTSLPAGVFSGLTALKYLDLGRNRLSRLEPGVFSGLAALEILYIHSNGLSSLPPNLFSGLTALEELSLVGNELNSLPPDIFSGLIALESVHFGNNNLSSLPDGIFAGLTALKRVFSSLNTLDPLPVPVSLEMVAASQFKAVVPTGAPFDLEITLSVTSAGAIANDESELTIPIGAVESPAVTVTRLAGKSDPVFADIATLPDLPVYHKGYALTKDEALPFEVLPATAPGEDASLRHLGVSVGTLAPAFTLGNTNYTVSLANSVPSITFTAMANGANAAVAYLDASDLALADADVAADGHQVNLAVGENTVKVQVTAEDTITTRTYTVVVTRNSGPVITTASPVSVEEGVVEVTMLTATDADGDDITWLTNGGADAARFDLTAGGVLTFKSAPDYEMPDDLDEDNEYVVVVEASDGLDVSYLTLSVGVTDADDGSSASDDASLSALSLSAGTLVPVFASETTGYTARVGAGVSSITVTPTTGDGNATIAYLDSSDQALDDADDSTDGQQVNLDPGRNTIQIRVTAEDTITLTTYTLVVTRNRAPVITTASPLSVNENETAVATLAATDADGDDIRWSTNDGADAQHFDLTAGGVLTFKVAPDYEDPADSDGDNEYELVVEASDGLGASSLTLTIAVTDVGDSQSVPEDASLSSLSLSAGTLAPAFVPGTTDYAARVGADVSSITITGATNEAAATIEYLDAGNQTLDDADEVVDGRQVDLSPGENTIKVKVTSEDTTTTRTYTLVVTRNRVPEITTTSPVSVSENETVVATLTATDADGDGIRWSTNGGADAHRFDSTADGELTFKAAPNYEDPADSDGDNEYEVVVEATDGFDANSLTLTVAVTDVYEADADASLSVLSISAGDLVPAFASGVTSYTARVANSVSSITLSPTTSSTSATVAYLDGSDQLLMDADDQTDGLQVSLALGENTMKVRVTAEDTTTTRTYTLFVTREREWDVCGRTPQVRDAIVAAVPNVNACGDVNETHLAGVRRLDLSDQRISSLGAEDFLGLTTLDVLGLHDNSLASLPDGIFSDLSLLSELRLNDNQLTSLPAVIFSPLTQLRVLYIHNNEIASLPSGLFIGMTELTTLWLNGNRLSELPAGIFSGLSSLGVLSLQRNSVDPVPLQISLQKVGESQVRAVALHGAPFAVSVPLSVSDAGEIEDGVSTLTIPTGAVESGSVTVSRLAGQQDAVTVNIGVLPDIPRVHLGYVLARDESLPLEILEHSTPQADATLGGLSLSGGSLNPVFASDQTDYTASVEYSTVTVTITLMPGDGNATVANLNASGQAHADADAFSSGQQVNLDVGENTIKLRVTAQDGTTTRTYTIVITRESATGVCGRTAEVRDAIVAAISGVADCGDVTETHLEGIERLNLSQKSIASVKSGDFGGMSGLIELDLSENDLGSLPSGVFSDIMAIQQLGLNHNDLSSLPAGIFFGLNHLRTLALESNKLSTLPSGVFSSLTALRYLGLTGNQLAGLSSGTFDGLTALVELRLGSNRLTALPSGVFSGLTALERIELQYNRLTALPSGVFSGLGALEVLLVSDNRLAGLPSGLFSDTDAVTSLNLARNSLSSLPSDLFSGLASLENLLLQENRLTGLPDEFFSGLGSLATLNLDGNAADPLPLTLSFGKDSEAKFKALVPAGAPFTLELPINVSSAGKVTGDVESVTVPAGTFESAVVEVTRVAGTSNAVTVNFGTLPGLPQGHQGYSLTTDADLPLEIISNTVLSDDATLRSLSLSAGTLDPAFGPGTTGYTASVINAVDTITVTPKVNDSAAIFAYLDANNQQKADADSAAEGYQVDLSVGVNTIKVQVKAEDGATIRTYVIMLTRYRAESVCNRTPQARDAIVAAVSGVDDCDEVTAGHLSQIQELSLQNDGVTSLRSGDFAGLGGLESLDLGLNELSSLPAGVFSGLTALETLTLSLNELGTLPSGIFSGLTALNDLDLSYCDLRSLPASIFSGLTALDSLALDGNELSALPNAIFSGLSALKTLGLGGNRLANLQSGLFSDLSALEDLRLSGNGIRSLPAGIFSAPGNLKTLVLSHNNLSTLPSGIFSGLSNLEGLRLHSNEFGSLPANFFSGLTALNYISLHNNDLTSLPSGLFAGLRSLNSLNLSGNSVDPLPLSVSLEKVGTSRFKAVAPVGAPFGLQIPVSVNSAGAIDGDADNVTIAAGAVESATLGVTRMAGATGAVTVDIGTLPNLPSNHEGYRLEKDTALPLQVLDQTVLSDNATLSGLSLSSGTLAPAFAAGTTDYTARVTNATTSITITPARADDGSTLEYRDANDLVLDDADMNTSGQQVDLSVGANTIKVKVTAEDTTTTQTYTVVVTRNRVPVITTTSPVAAEENHTAVATLAATDADSDPITWSKNGGVDASLFDLTSGGVLTFASAPNFESPDDDGEDNAYVVVVRASDGADTADLTLTVNVTDVSEVEVLSDKTSLSNLTLSSGTLVGEFDSATTRYAALVENTASSITVTPTKSDSNATLVYLDANDQTLADADPNTSGQQVSLSVGANTIKMRVTSEDETETQTHTVVVTRNNLPVFTTTSPISVEENSTFVADLEATDAENHELTWYIAGGFDSSRFTVTSEGELTFKSAPDFENPADSNENNDYVVTVGVRDALDVSGLDLIINVTDVDERLDSPDATLSGLSLSSGTLAPAFAAGTTDYTARVTNATTSITITPARADDGSTLEYRDANDLVLDDADMNTSGQQVDLSVGANTIKVKVTAEDTTTTQTYTVVVTRNRVPVITTTSPVAAEENHTAVATLAATDADSDPITWSKNGGVDASLFDLTSGGVLTFASAPNFESPDDDGEDNAYVVVVRASDGADTADLTLTVNVTDVDDGELSTDARLGGLSLSDGTLSPAFASGTTDYTASVGSSVSSITVSATTSHANATPRFLEVRNKVLTDADTDTDGHQLSLSVGTNTIRVQVTAEDGTAVKTYTLVVIRGSATGVCARTEQVRDAIVAEVSTVDACEDVTASHLSEISQLYLTAQNISSLKSGDFDGLTSLTLLSIDVNPIESLPSDVFFGLTELYSLVLSSNELGSLPSDVFSGLTKLVYLVLSGNELVSLPADIFSGLGALTELNLDGNKLSSLPSGLFSGLGTLEILELSSNKLTSLPENIFSGLTALDSLRLFANDLTTLPSEVFSDLSSLEYLTLSQNDFSSLPSDAFSGLTALETLNMATSKLTSLPSEIFSDLTSLETLNLAFNRLASLPSGVFSDLSPLESLNVASNRLTVLPDGVFSGLSNLERLALGLNPGAPFPISVSLEKVESSQFKAVVPAGAPFTMDLPVTVSSDGTIDGDVKTVTVSIGALESSAVDVTRVSETSGAVTVNIGTLPSLPQNYAGIALEKDSALPLEVLPATSGVSPDAAIADASFADVNGNARIEADDAMIIYHAIESAGALGDGEIGGAPVARATLLAGLADTLDPDDDVLMEMLRKANLWRDVGLAHGGDINEDGVIDGSDAFVMYYAYEFADLVGDGETGGTARHRQHLLSSRSNKDNPTDEDLKKMLRRANQLREDFG